METWGWQPNLCQNGCISWMLLTLQTRHVYNTSHADITARVVFLSSREIATGISLYLHQWSRCISYLAPLRHSPLLLLEILGCRWVRSSTHSFKHSEVLLIIGYSRDHVTNGDETDEKWHGISSVNWNISDRVSLQQTGQHLFLSAFPRSQCEAYLHDWSMNRIKTSND